MDDFQSTSEDADGAAHPEFADLKKRLASFNLPRRGGREFDRTLAAVSGFFADGAGNATCYHCGMTELFDMSYFLMLDMRHLNSHSTCPECRKFQARYRQHDELQDRIDSFAKTRYPEHKATSLARAGFCTWRANSDVPQCFICRLKLPKAEVESGEHPFRIHARLSPDCLYVRFPPGFADLPARRPLDRTFTTYESSQPKRPVFVQYATPERRWETFVNWDGVINEEDLVKAGMFSLKQADYVRCFNCGVGFKNFKEGEDPVEVHLKYSPDCELLNCYIAERQAKMDSGEVPSLWRPHEYNRNPRNVYVSLPRDRLLGATTDEVEGHPPEESTPICTICMAEPRAVLHLPCGDFKCCLGCSQASFYCPTCHEGIKYRIRISPDYDEVFSSEEDQSSERAFSDY